MSHEYGIGDVVEVEMPHGWISGRVVEILPNYAWTGETHYSIHGKEMVTISSARSIRSPDMFSVGH